MFEKKLLLASSRKDEAITKWVLEHDLSPAAIDVLFIEDLLINMDIQDELDENGPVIQWSNHQGAMYSNRTHYLLNRVTYVDDDLFQRFRPEDRDYAQREFEAYLGFAMHAFKSPQFPAINGVCERFMTLPQQWQLVKKSNEIAIPEYYWGSPHYDFLSEKENVVYSSIFDCLNWSAEPVYSQQESSFRFIKPNGNPLFVLSIGEQSLITFDEPLSAEMQKRIACVTQEICSLFNYFIFELLLFVDGSKLTFGCVNIDVIQSANNPEFSHFIQKHLVGESSKCLN